MTPEKYRERWDRRAEQDPGAAEEGAPREEPELDEEGHEIVRVWLRVRGHTRPGTPQQEKHWKGKELVDVTVTPYFLDAGEIRSVAALLRPKVSPDHLLECLELMQASHTHDKVAYVLSEDLAQRLADNPELLHQERARLGYLR